MDCIALCSLIHHLHPRHRHHLGHRYHCLALHSHFGTEVNYKHKSASFKSVNIQKMSGGKGEVGTINRVEKSVGISCKLSYFKMTQTLPKILKMTSRLPKFPNLTQRFLKTSEYDPESSKYKQRAPNVFSNNWWKIQSLSCRKGLAKNNPTCANTNGWGSWMPWVMGFWFFWFFWFFCNFMWFLQK